MTTDFRALCAELLEALDGWHQAVFETGTGWVRPDETYLIDRARAALAAESEPPAIAPIPVSERLPEAGRKVIAHYVNSLGNSRTVCAEWVPAKSRTDDCLVDDDFSEYDEEADEYYWAQGWYESIENWDEYGAVFINHAVTHWQPLPSGPAHALPLPSPTGDDT